MPLSRVTLWPWPFDLLTLSVFLIEWLARRTHVPIFVILRLSVTTEFDHISAIANSHCACAVWIDLLPGEWSTFLKSLTLIYLCNFQGATTKIKQCYRRKIVFPWWSLQSSLRMRRRVPTRHLITHANFCEDRLRGFGVARGRILAFSIDWRRHLKTLSHYPQVCDLWGRSLESPTVKKFPSASST